mgnify:FL=1
MAAVHKKNGFITIEGNIGAGKTTLCRMLARDYNHRLILEQFSDNPFLPLFYEDPERYAFTVELFFMTERHKQLQKELSQRNLFGENILSDYFFLKTLLFARNNLSGEEYRLFQRLFHILNAPFPKPDLLLYLHRPVPQLLHHIAKRGRSFESDITAAYLEQLQQAYFDFFRAERSFPIVVLDLDAADFTADQTVYEHIAGLLHHDFPVGTTYLDLEEASHLIPPS